MQTLIGLFLAVLCSATLTGQLCAGFIIAGQHELLPNKAGQVINIFADPSDVGELAPGLNLNFVVDDGGSIVGGFDNNAPKITDIDLKPTGGLFASLPDSQTTFPSQKLFQATIAVTNLANRPVIEANSLLAQVTFDTTGLTSGNWVLDLDGIAAVDLPSSDFAGSPTTVFNGSINITNVPEPSSLAILVLATSASCMRRRFYS